MRSGGVRADGVAMVCFLVLWVCKDGQRCCVAVIVVGFASLVALFSCFLGAVFTGSRIRLFMDLYCSFCWDGKQANLLCICTCVSNLS